MPEQNPFQVIRHQINFLSELSTFLAENIQITALTHQLTPQQESKITTLHEQSRHYITQLYACLVTLDGDYRKIFIQQGVTAPPSYPCLHVELHKQLYHLKQHGDDKSKPESSK